MEMSCMMGLRILLGWQVPERGHYIEANGLCYTKRCMPHIPEERPPTVK
jgi:hypothetical protein